MSDLEFVMRGIKTILESGVFFKSDERFEWIAEANKRLADRPDYIDEHPAARGRRFTP